MNKYANIMLIGDLNLNTKPKNNSYYSDLCDTFDLTDLIKANTCFKSSNQTSIDVILTNRLRSFKTSWVITTGLSDYRKMISTFCCSYFSRLPPKTITYRSFRYFEIKHFLYELENKLLTKECNGGLKYDDLTDIFRSTLDSHAPLKQKQAKGIKLLLWQKNWPKGSSIYDVHKNDQFWPPLYTHHPQKWTIDLLFKNNKIRKHMTNFKTAPTPLLCGRHKFIVPKQLWQDLERTIQRELFSPSNKEQMHKPNKDS